MAEFMMPALRRAIGGLVLRLSEDITGVWRMSAVRLAAQLTLGFVLILVLGWLAMLWLVQREVDALAHRDLEREAVAAHAYWQAQGELPVPAWRGQLLALAPATGGPPLVQGPSFPESWWRRDGFFSASLPEFNEDDDEDEEYEAARALVRRFDAATLLVVHPADRGDDIVEILNSGFGWIAGISLAATGILALIAAHRTQRRIKGIEQGLDCIAAGRFETRIGQGVVVAADDDLARVAARIDTTTARMAQLMAQLRTQASHIAHDLRTPLARLRAGLEEELTSNPAPSAAVATALAQTDAMIETFNALLRIAAVESGTRKQAFRPVELAAIGEQVGQTYAAVIEEAGQTFELRALPGQPVQGDAELLVQLLANLVQNAVRYGTCERGSGHIVLIAGPDRLELRDRGPGIAEELRERVLEPLFRLDTTRQSEGSGLGLSLVKAIADLHDAELTLHDNPEADTGLAVRLVFQRR